MNEKLEAAIAYLRSRGKYICDTKNRFKPTDAANTNVEETMRQYRIDVERQPAVKLVGKRR